MRCEASSGRRVGGLCAGKDCRVSGQHVASFPQELGLSHRHRVLCSCGWIAILSESLVTMKVKQSLLANGSGLCYSRKVAVRAVEPPGGLLGLPEEGSGKLVRRVRVEAALVAPPGPL